MIENMENEKKNRKVKVIDRRSVGLNDDAPSEEPSLKPSYVEQLESKVSRMETALRSKMEELEDEAARSRERVARDAEKRFEEKADALLLDVLDILETVERAAKLVSQDPTTREGFELLRQSLERFLEKNGLEKISALGEDFDPNMMEALSMAPGPRGKVVEIFQNGYFRGDKLLKPARVVVGSGG